MHQEITILTSTTTRKFHKDRGLATRMYFTMFMLGFLYAVFALFLMAAGMQLMFVGGIVGIMVVVQYYMSDKLILMSTGAKTVTAEQQPALHKMVKLLADRYEMPMPKVAVIDTPIPNAFATGRNPKNALVAVTTGIQQRLNERELQAVIGHELAHVANRDMRVLAIANFLVTVTSFLMTMLFWNMLFGGMGGRRNNNGGGVMMVYLVTMIVYFIGQLLVLALTRYREYGADHTGAEISGDPGALADALEKISGTVANIPDKDLRKLQTASAFLIIPAALKGEGSMNLFSTHPPLQERVKRLRELEQRMRYGLR
ncbi:MAG: zinc metalloprotease HtpX [Chloroflexi bacterium]|jgi:heat shock protein HtpX|nr:zinc metalloprotease HtpX [Chloroflexota bacterium]MBT5627010.1 zinc metalloprotease HtpX [Chloroflexota bacterium]